MIAFPPGALAAQAQTPTPLARSTSRDPENADPSVGAQRTDCVSPSTAPGYEAVYPDGTTEVLLDVPKYDFNWQTTYKYKNYKEVPEGTKVIFTSAWDNSADNPYNPDPDTVVRWGEPTTDEMSFGFMSFINEANEGADLFDNGVFDITAVVAFTDKSRDGKMQLEEAPEQVKSYFQMMDQNQDGGIDMSEARAATEFLEQQGAAKEAKAEAEGAAPPADAGR